MSRLMDVSNRVYKPIADTAELFIRTSESLKQMGYTTAETVDMVETLSYGLTVSSASADKTKSVIDAWSKSMLQGKMTMGEYQTVISGAPALQKALADALGVTIAGLQEMVSKGQLSADKLMLVTKQMQELGKQADAMPVTVTDAFTKLVNSVTQYAGELNKSTGATSLLTGAIGILANNVGPVLTMLATMVGMAVASWLTTVMTAAVAAGGAFTAAAVAVKGFMASLGPLGWLVLAVGAGTAAYQAFSKSAADAGKAAQDAAVASEGAAQKMMSGLGVTLDALAKKYADIVAEQRKALGIEKSPIAKAEDEYASANERLREHGRIINDINTKAGKFSGMNTGQLDKERSEALAKLAEDTKRVISLEKDREEARKNAVTLYIADTGRMTDAQRKTADLAKETASYEKAIALAQGDAGQIAQITAAHQTALGEIRSKYSKQSVAGVKQEEKSYLSLLDAINARIAQEKLERQSGEATTESQRIRIKLQAELKQNITSDHKAILETRLKELEVEEKLTATYKDAAEARKAWKEQQKQNVDAAFANAASLEEGNKQLRDEIALIGKTRKEQETILRLRREQVIAVKEGELAALQAKNSFDVYDTAMIEALQEQIKQLRERNELLGQKEVAEDTAALVEKQQGNWVSFFQSIDQSAHQTWTNVFEDGAGTFKRLGQTLKTAVLDMLYQLTIRKWIINIGASLFGDGSSAMMGALSSVLGGSGGGGSNAMGLFSNGKTAYDLYTGNGMMGQAWNYVSGLWGGGSSAAASGLGLSSTSPGLGLGVGKGSSGLGLGAPSSGYFGTAPATAAIPAGTPGAAASAGWGTAAGAAAGIIAVAYLAGMFKEERMVGQGLTGDLGGDMYGYQLMRESGGLFDGPNYRYLVAEKEVAEAKARIAELQTGKPYADLGEKGDALRERELQRLYSRLDMLDREYGGAIEGSHGPIKIIQDAFEGMREGTASKADTLGLNGDAIRAMKVALGVDEIHPDTGGKGLQLTGLTQEEAAAKIQEALNQANEELARSVLGSWQEQTREITRVIFDQVSLGDGGGDTEQFGRVGREVTETITEQVWVMSEFVREGETAVQALDRMSGSLVGVNNVFELLGATLVDASLAGGDWASKLVEAIGGMDALTAAAGSYFDLYYSDEEKRSRAAAAVNKAMTDKGLDLQVGDADAKKKYRDLVDKAIAAQDEALIAWLLQFGDDFAAGVDAFTSGLEQAASAMQEQLAEMARIREETLSTIGLSMDGLVDGFIQEINEGRGAQAGSWLADQIAFGFEEAVYQQGVTAILGSMIDGMITPMVTAAMTGASIADSVSGAAIDNMIANANAALQALNSLLSSVEFQEGMEKIKVTIGSLGNSIGASIPPMRNYHAAVSDVGKTYDRAANAADDAAKAAQKLTDEWRKLIDSMSNEMDRLRGALLGGSQDQGMAYYESMFAIKTAQARAGDQDAAAELPSIIKALEELARGNASSQADVLLKQAEWLASLTDTRDYLAGKYGVDIGNQQIAEVASAAAGRVMQTAGSAAFSGALQSSSDNPAVLAELRALRSEVEFLRKDHRAIGESELTSLNNIDRSTKRLVQRAETEAA